MTSPTPPVAGNPPAVDPFNDLNDLQEEIEDVFHQLSGVSADAELREVIGQEHEDLMQRIGQRAQQTLQVQEDIEGIIHELTSASEAIDNTLFYDRIAQLRETLALVQEKQETLTTQMKTSASFLLATQEHTREIRKTSHELRKTVQHAPPKGAKMSSDIQMGGTLFCRALGGLRFN